MGYRGFDAAGTDATVVVRIPIEPFRRWDRTGWVVDPGTWQVHVARSATDVHQTLELQLT